MNFLFNTVAAYAIFSISAWILPLSFSHEMEKKPKIEMVLGSQFFGLIENSAEVSIESLNPPTDAQHGAVWLGEKEAFLLKKALRDDRNYIFAWSKTNLANYKVPRHVTFVEALPTNASGKILKFELRRMAEKSA